MAASREPLGCAVPLALIAFAAACFDSQDDDLEILDSSQQISVVSASPPAILGEASGRVLPMPVDQAVVTYLSMRARRHERPPAVFRFDSARFVGPSTPSHVREGSPIDSILSEIQIQTAFGHAWSTTTHALTSKSEHVGWRKLRLAATLRAAVEQIDLAVAGFGRTAADVLPGVW